MYKLMKFGVCIFKIGIVIIFVFYLVLWIGFFVLIFVGIVVIFVIQLLIYCFFFIIIDQVQVNIIGVVIVIVFGFIFGFSLIMIGLIVVIVIIIMLKFKIEYIILIVFVIVIVILEFVGDDFLMFVLIRISIVILGVFFFFIVNFVFLFFKYEIKLIYNIVENIEEIMKWIRLFMWQLIEYLILKEDIEKLKEKMIKFDQIYFLYKEERSYFKKMIYVKLRKFVLFRQVIIIVNWVFDILKKLYCLENEIYYMLEEFQEILIEEFDYLFYWYELILMRFVGKIKLYDDVDEEGI